jgi:uncharacterized protein YidB (DUF937 family)
MSLFDDLAGKLAPSIGTPGSGGQNLAQSVLSLLNDPQHGGLPGLVQSFEKQGLGGVIGSWIGTGPNQPISPQQIGNALGAGRLQQLSASTGLPLEALGGQLAGALPGLIDKLTPAGTMPQGDLMAHAEGLLKGMFSSGENR